MYTNLHSNWSILDTHKKKMWLIGGSGGIRTGTGDRPRIETEELTRSRLRKRKSRRRRLHSKWCSCTEEVGKEVRKGLSEVIGIGCRCRCFISVSTWKPICAHTHAWLQSCKSKSLPTPISWCWRSVKVSVCSREISFPLMGEYLYLIGSKSLLVTHIHRVLAHLP